MAHPESEQILDWFHLTMRFTVLHQLAKGLVQSDPVVGKALTEKVESAKRYLWHGNVNNGLEALESAEWLADQEEIPYSHHKKLLKQLSEMTTYVECLYCFFNTSDF